MPYKDPKRQKQAQHDWYVQNRELTLERGKANSVRFRRQRSLWLQELKSILSCRVCGENRFPCLDFHHRDPTTKEMAVSKAVWGRSKKFVLEELAKCDVLCRNCHAMLHWEEKNGEHCSVVGDQS